MTDLAAPPGVRSIAGQAHPLAMEIVEQIAAQAVLPLEQALPLPAAAYWDPDFHALELDRIFRRDWICVARAEEVPVPGSYLAVDVAGEPLIVVRGRDQQVRVFSRVCRHRYEDLLGGETPPDARVKGCVDRFECPYHAWTYRLDGSLLSAPEMAARPDFRKESWGLHQIRTEQWQGFVFVNLDDQAAVPFDMSGIERVQDGYDFTGWRIASRIEWGETRVNWKIVVENFLECYHHIGIHKNVLQPLWRLGKVQRGDYLGADWYYARMMAGPETAAGEEDGHLQMPLWLPAARGLSAYQRSHTLLFARFPLFMLAPGPDISFWFRATPTGPETHHLEMDLLVPEDSFAAENYQAGIQEATDFLRMVQTQDASVNERVQSTAKSRFARGGCLSVHEQPIWQIQKYLAERLSG
jgi:phenylpropionate dioxygenase-like ring-hydroxylating dioxygenase large terminal subunit